MKPFHSPRSLWPGYFILHQNSSAELLGNLRAVGSSHRKVVLPVVNVQRTSCKNSQSTFTTIEQWLFCTIVCCDFPQLKSLSMNSVNTQVAVTPRKRMSKAEISRSFRVYSHWLKCLVHFNQTLVHLPKKSGSFVNVQSNSASKLLSA